MPTLIAGGLLGFAWAFRPSDAYARVVGAAPKLRRTWKSALSIGANAMWPDFVVVTVGTLLARAALLVWSPADAVSESLLVAPLVAFLLWGGWRMVQTRASEAFLQDAAPAPRSARALLLRHVRAPWWLILGTALALPLVHLMARFGEHLVPLFLAGFAVTSLSLHVGLAHSLARRRGLRPYVLLPTSARILVSGGGLMLFAIAFWLVAAAVLRHGGRFAAVVALVLLTTTSALPAQGTGPELFRIAVTWGKGRPVLDAHANLEFAAPVGLKLPTDVVFSLRPAAAAWSRRVAAAHLGGGRFAAVVPVGAGEETWGVFARPAIAPTPGSGRNAIRWTEAPAAEAGKGRWAFWRGRSVGFAWCHGLQVKAGVAPKWRRAQYVYPAIIDGVNILDDFPEDHLHHRGISWMWPQVVVDGKTHDLWTLVGIAHRFEKLRHKLLHRDVLALDLDAGWFVGARKVVSERARVLAWPARLGRREPGLILDFHFRWDAVEGGVVLRGQKTQKKGYGGFGARVAPRADGVLTADGSRLAKDTLHARYRWVDYSARFRGADRPSGVAVMSHPSNAAAPSEWLARHYGYIGESWPGLAGAALERGAGVERRFRVYLHRGTAEEARVADLYRAYAHPPRVRVL